MRKNEAKKTEELKKRIDYEQGKITQEEQKRELIRLEAKKEHERLDSERIKQQEELEMRQFQRQVDLAKMKLEEKNRLKVEQEREVSEEKSQTYSLNLFNDNYIIAGSSQTRASVERIQRDKR